MKKWVFVALLVWIIKPCFTLNDVTAFLNSLPPEKSKTAKVVAINSQRSFMGVLSTPYYVWYEGEAVTPEGE